jgi:cation diffusion facilitator CzcD-associated flavoprotein CzcO
VEVIERDVVADVVVDVAIVGTGFGGLCTAIQLVREGRGRSFVILEKADDVGGTWRANHYPGCACDVPSHLYSFSFAPNPHWTRAYAPQAEILAYLERCVFQFGLRDKIRFGAEVTDAAFDEARGRWTVRTANGLTVSARHFVLGSGALSRPSVPRLPGIERFGGRTFHSAAWDHAYDMTGRNVAVVGTGASAIQLVPHVARAAGHLDLYQRTPPWVLPRNDRAMTARERRLFARVPLARRAYRAWIYGLMEATALGFLGQPAILRLAAKAGREHIRAQIRDEALRAKVTPTYSPGCKRILIGDDYYPALSRPNVAVVTDGIREVDARGIVTEDGVHHPADAIVFATGFRPTDLLTPLTIRGEGGVDLNDAWAGGIEAYLGTTIAGYPNFYMLTGPNTGLGHNSMVFMIEAQVNHVLALMNEVDRRGVRTARVRREAQARHNAALAPRFARSVWASGCHSWYLDARGKNVTIWPGFTVEYWWRTRQLARGDYEFR